MSVSHCRVFLRIFLQIAQEGRIPYLRPIRYLRRFARHHGLCLARKGKKAVCADCAAGVDGIQAIGAKNGYRQ